MRPIGSKSTTAAHNSGKSAKKRKPTQKGAKAATRKSSSSDSLSASEWDDDDHTPSPASSSPATSVSPASSRTPSPPPPEGYWQHGASSTALLNQNRNSDSSLSLRSLDLAIGELSPPMLVPPVAIAWTGQAAHAVDDLLVPVKALNDGRLVDPSGRSYLPGNFDRKTALSTGGMLLSFDAVKVQAYWAKKIPMPQDGQFPAELRQEVDLMRKAGGALRPHTILQASDAFYLLMPHMLGDHLSLFHVINRWRTSEAASASHASTTSMQEVVSLYVENLLKDVAQLHKRNIFHRDIKLENALYDADGTSFLSDFGSAHEGPLAHVAASTPGYLAPDHLLAPQGKDPAKADIFALGTSIFSLYTGGNFLFPAVDAHARSTQSPNEKNKELGAAIERFGAAWQRMQGLAQEHVDHLGGEGYALTPAAHWLSVAPGEPGLLGVGEPIWDYTFSLLLERAPALAPLIVAMLAPSDALRPSAQQALERFSGMSNGLSSTRREEIQKLLGSMHANELRAARAKGSALVAQMHDRLAAKTPLVDELQLENQPDVTSLDQARAYIKRLASEAPPSIPAVPNRGGGIKRIREMTVKLR